MICLELLGMSRAGKTTQKQMLSERLQSKGVDSTTIERPKIPFNKFNSLYHFHDYLIDFFNEEIDKNKNKDVIILDRGGNDRGVLLNLDYKSNTISSSDYNALNSKLQELIPKIDIGFLFIVPPKESLKRWHAQKTKGLDFSHLNKGLPSWDNYRNLKTLYNAYSSLIDNQHIQPINGLDTIDSNFNKIFRSITKNAK
jgi:thymidylate kinase